VSTASAEKAQASRRGIRLSGGATRIDSIRHSTESNSSKWSRASAVAACRITKGPVLLEKRTAANHALEGVALQRAAKKDALSAAPSPARIDGSRAASSCRPNAANDTACSQ